MRSSKLTNRPRPWVCVLEGTPKVPYNRDIAATRGGIWGVMMSTCPCPWGLTTSIACGGSS